MENYRGVEYKTVLAWVEDHIGYVQFNRPKELNAINPKLLEEFSEVLNAFDIFIGVNATDYSGYPDCRPDFISAYQTMANLATAAAVENKGQYKIHTPIINLTKGQIIQRGYSLGLDYSLTHSCYDPDEQGRSCGRCDSCRLRLKGFAEAALRDPVEYIK